MIIRTDHWQKLFLCCLGVFIGAAFCMKWMEADFVINGETFTIIGMEISYSRDKVSAILAELDAPVKNILRYHLAFDFAFMAGVYPGIAALCMIGRGKTKNRTLKKLLFVIAALQTIAYACDICENLYLFKWIKYPVISESEFSLYHILVTAKWIIAITGALLAIPLSLRQIKNIKSHFLI